MNLDGMVLGPGMTCGWKFGGKDVKYNGICIVNWKFGNMQATIMSQMGDLDLTDAAVVKAVFDSIDEAVKTINVSFVMTKAAN